MSALLGIAVLAACRASAGGASTSVEFVTAPASTTTVSAAATTEQAEDASAVCRGCLEPPDLPTWVPPATPRDASSEPLKKLAAGTYITRLFQPTVTFTVPEGWTTAGENSFGVTLSTRFSTSFHAWKVIDILNPAAYGLDLDWEGLVQGLRAVSRPDGSSALDPPTEAGITYPAGEAAETLVGGFPARSVIYSMPSPPVVLGFQGPRPGFLAHTSLVVRFTMIDMDGEPLLVVVGAWAGSVGSFGDNYRLWNEFVAEAEPVIDSLTISR